MSSRGSGRPADGAGLPPELARALAALDPALPLLVALDFDGTLSRLVPVPSDARPVPGALELLERLAACPDTEVALVSGRALADLASVSGAAELALLVGSHGQELGAHRALAPDEVDVLTGLRAEIATAVDGIPGVRLEDKPTGLAVHVRQCTPEDGRRAEDRVREVLATRSGLHVLEGKLVIEASVRPLDKGSALRTFIAERPERRVLFAGDDVTDEAAMAVLRPGDLSIKVGAGATLAQFRVPDPDAMLGVLAALVAARSE